MLRRWITRQMFIVAVVSAIIGLMVWLSFVVESALRWRDLEEVAREIAFREMVCGRVGRRWDHERRECVEIYQPRHHRRRGDLET